MSEAHFIVAQTMSDKVHGAEFIMIILLPLPPPPSILFFYCIPAPAECHLSVFNQQLQV